MPQLPRCTYLTALTACLFVTLNGWAQYRLVVIPTDKDSAFVKDQVKLQTSFKNVAACVVYIDNLAATLQAKGYPGASVDSVQVDSTEATVQLFLGESFQFSLINTSTIEPGILEQAGWNDRKILDKPLNIEQLEAFKTRMLDYLENNGYPFATLQLDSIQFNKEKLTGRFSLNKGPLYKIDSIRVFGNVNISKSFLQHYLEVGNGSIYRKNKLKNISRKLMELAYLEEQQPWNMTMLGTGSIINLYLKAKKSSQVNVLIGLLPSNQQTANAKLLITGEANINLRNTLGNGESIALNWQNIQVKSPRLNLTFHQPYLFGSFGISTSFDLFKKDSSFLNLNFTLGIQYSLTGSNNGRVFIQSLRTNLLTVDTQRIKTIRKLPNEIDVSSINLGVDYDLNRTNYRYNPRSGYEGQLTVSAGTRNIRKNNVIVKMVDPAFNYASLYDSIKQNAYQFRVKMYAAYFLPVSRQSTVKIAIHAGWFQSPSIFRNELFQIGGYKLLRGFDEESIFASQYVVGNLEYRYLIGLNSFVFTFIDAGWASNKSNALNTGNGFAGGGLGLAFETKAGIFNISFAAGKRNDSRLDIRQSKIHLGYVSYF
ncbi:MAG: hypothetical protein WKF97_18535 [Chitinophagaceae bacterium]